MTSEPVTRTECAVRYTEAPYTGAMVAFVDRASAEQRAAGENCFESFRCVVVRREVTYGEWTEVE